MKALKTPCMCQHLQEGLGGGNVSCVREHRGKLGLKGGVQRLKVEATPAAREHRD